MPGHRLFVYGTLKQADLLRRLLGKVPPAVDASLDHYCRYRLRGRPYPGIRHRRHDHVDGRLLSGLSATQLRALDHYEGSEYRRTRVWVNTGRGKLPAWVYVLRRPA